MVKFNLLNKVMGVITAVTLMVVPMTTVKANDTVDNYDIEYTSLARSYSDWYDEDITLYVSEIDDYFHGHLSFVYSYDEGSSSWYNRTPSLSDAYTDTGYANVSGPWISGGVADFDVTVSSDSGVANITIRVDVDIYGEISIFIL